MDNKNFQMTHLTRDVLIKSIVAAEMKGIDGNDYIQSLKNAYQKWQHESSDSLCKKFNNLRHTTISVEQLES